YHTAHLFGPAGSNFDLYIDKWNGSAWVAVDWVTSASTNEVLASYQTSGQYRWRVVATSGSGTMNIYANRPQ
ncbi:MAG: aqualysin 1, partial [Acidobacteriota bacterium]|nr:aqualysin 1 [Acidobacteriota bacterium]